MPGGEVCKELIYAVFQRRSSAVSPIYRLLLQTSYTSMIALALQPFQGKRKIES